MGRTRIIGYHIQRLLNERNITYKKLSKLFECEEWQIKALIQGRMFVSFEQLCKLANLFDISTSELIHGNVEQYNEYMTDCVGHFSNNNNRDIILDLIDEYLDVLDATAV